MKQRKDANPTHLHHFAHLNKIAIFIHACMFIFLAAITALARTAPETERRADLLDLASWTMARTDALGKANSNDDIQRAVDAFLSQNVSILINGASISRSAFIESLESALAGRVSSAAIYSSIIEVPADPTSPATVRP